MNYEKLTIKMAIDLANPPSWVASVIPSVFGVLFCFRYGLGLGLFKSIALILVCIFMQAAVNTLNDYFDYVKGTDQKTDNLEVSDAVLLYNNINPKHALALGIGYLAAAAVLGISCAWGCGPIPYILGIIGGLCVVFYSGGKHPISYFPVGELISGIVMGAFIPLAIVSIALGGRGLDMPGTYLIVLLQSIPFVIGIALIMMTNNTCDIEKDIAAGRKTFPSLSGREKSVKIYRTLSKLWFAWILIIGILSYSNIESIILLAAFEVFLARGKFRFLWTSPLTPDKRINQMKGIIAANIFGNGLYTFIVFFDALMAMAK